MKPGNYFKTEYNKRAGWKISQKLINVQDVIRLCRLEFFKKLIKRAARLLDTLEYFL